jgi:hypothetical protein
MLQILSWTFLCVYVSSHINYLPVRLSLCSQLLYPIQCVHYLMFQVLLQKFCLCLAVIFLEPLYASVICIAVEVNKLLEKLIKLLPLAYNSGWTI